MSENSDNVHHNFLKPNKTFLNCLFYPTNSPNPKDIQFTITYDNEVEQISTI